MNDYGTYTNTNTLSHCMHDNLLLFISKLNKHFGEENVHAIRINPTLEQRNELSMYQKPIHDTNKCVLKANTCTEAEDTL